MSFLSTLALIMLTLVGYSSGATLTGRRKAIPPAVLIDLVTVPVLWLLAFISRNLLSLNHWVVVVIWLLIGIVVGWGSTAVRYSHVPDSIPLSPLPIGINPVRQLWERWKRFSIDMGNVQGRLLSGYFYFIIVTPFGIGVRLLSDNLQLKQPANGWTTREPHYGTLEEAKEQG